MKRAFRVAYAVAVAAVITNTQHAYAQWVVNDPMLNMQTQMNQAANIAKYTQQIAQLKSQLDQMKRQYDAVTGSYNRGKGIAEAIASSKVIPGSWQEVVAQQSSGTFSSKKAYYEKLIQTLPKELFRAPESQTATNYKLSTDSVRAAMAGGDALYGEVQIHLGNLDHLSKQIDNTTNIKDASDLQNRIGVENGLLQTALAKLNVMNMNLQANLVNQQNQSTATNQKFFTWDD